MLYWPTQWSRRAENLHRPAHAVESLKELSDLQEAYSSPDFNVLIAIRCLLAKERVYGSRWPCSCTRPLMELRRHTWVNWFVSPIYLVDVPSALLGPIVCWCRPWNCLPYVGGRAFPVAGPTIWDSLPDNVISAPSLSTFRQRLKTFLFQASFPDIIIDPR